MIALQIIASSGDGKALAFDALVAAQGGDFEQAKELLKESDKASLVAHNAQTDLLVAEAKGEAAEMNVLLVHAQDHLMGGMLAQELIAEMVKMYLHFHQFSQITVFYYFSG